jgi:hypothetical protein
VLQVAATAQHDRNLVITTGSHHAVLLCSTVVVKNSSLHAICFQVLERLKAAAAYVKLAQSFTKPTKTAEAKLAKAAAKLAKLPGLGSMEPAAAAAAAAATVASPVAAAVAVLAPVLQQASSAKVRGLQRATTHC